MSKKRILNIASTKKRDTMMCYTNSTSTTQAGGATYAVAPAVITGGSTDQYVACFLWDATARDNVLASGSSAVGTTFNSSTRTSSTPYMIGLAERIEIQCNTGMPWQWRRICYTYKGPSVIANSSTSGTAFANQFETSDGWQRVMNQVPTQSTLFSLIFRGAQGRDWYDPMTAPTDNSLITVKYDNTTSLASGNEDGFIRSYKRWHPMYKTLVYGDDEAGGDKVAVVNSARGGKGMGDYWVVDLFRARIGSTSSDQITVRPEATLYWHER